MGKIMVWLNFINTISSSFWANIGIFTIFVVALVGIFLFEREKIKRYIYLWYTLLVLFLIYNPLSYFLAKSFLEQSTFEQYYLRFFSLAPIVFVIAFGMTLLVDKFSGLKKMLAVIAALGVIVLCGDLLYNEDWFTVSENRMKIPQDVVVISDFFSNETALANLGYSLDENNDIVLSDKTSSTQETADGLEMSEDELLEGFKDTEEQYVYEQTEITEKLIRIMAPQEIAVYLRQYDERFSLPFTRYVEDIAYELTNQAPQVQEVVSYCNKNNIDFIVVSKNPEIVNKYLNYGFEFLAWTNKYALLKVMPEPSWILTEYNMASGDQGMFYTMVNRKDGTLIVIDGGDIANEAQVRKAIKDNGGVVDAWILTHYHQDHCSVFNAVYQNPQGIKIKDIYATPLDTSIFHSVAQEWDDVEVYDKFHEITVDDKRVHYILRDDKLAFDNLEITFLNACDDVVYDNKEDIPNNASLVLKLKTEYRSAIICADCHSKGMGEYLVNTYGDELDCDVLQLAHHGNNSIPQETGFYEKTTPEVAIFDCPDWVLNGEQYTAKDLKQYLEENGIRTVSYATAPNVFGF